VPELNLKSHQHALSIIQNTVHQVLAEKIHQKTIKHNKTAVSGSCSWAS